MAAPSDTSMINPYELFGIDPQKTTARELKKKYYEWAMMVHPDKNPGSDMRSSASEMSVVHNAYKYCLREVEHTASKEATVEGLSASFEAFCKLQSEQPPSFRDIMEDALEMQKFNAEFEKKRAAEEGVLPGYGGIFTASFQGGYGALMDESEYSSPSNVGETAIHATAPSSSSIPADIGVSYCDTAIDVPLKHTFSDAVIVHREQIMAAPNGECLDYFDYARAEPVETYTVHMKRGMCLSDYKEANTFTPIPTSNTLQHKEAAMKAISLEQLMEERRSVLSSREDKFRHKEIEVSA
jgi:DnaJ domain